jgi:hypothetical protein
VTLIAIGLLITWLQPSDVQIPIRYNGFNVDFSSRQGNLLKDQWYERISFVIFAVLQFGALIWLAIKMFDGGYRVMAKFLLAGGILSLIILSLIGFFINRTITL